MAGAQEIGDLVTRLRRADASIWGPPDTPELANRLGWLRLAETMVPRMAGLEELAASLLAEGIDDVVLLGMGGSSLAPEVFAATLPARPGSPRLTVLDSTHPDAVSDVRSRIDPAGTLFLVSSKSGTTLETLSGFRYFWEESGAEGRRFVAITDPGTPLEKLARERGFRAVVAAPADVGGRFSALTAFGLLPAVLLGIDASSLLRAASGVDWEGSVGWGLQLAEMTGQAVDKLTIRTSPAVSALPAWLEQLFAESLGKQGKGILPVVDEPFLDRYSNDRVFLEIRGPGQPVVSAPAGYPVLRREIARLEELGGEMMAAEIATAVAGAAMRVHPFDQPDVESAKEKAREALGAEPPRVDLLEVISPVLSDRLDDLLAAMREGSYFAIHAYLPRRPAADDALSRVRHKIGNRTGMPTTLGYGPRFLHSTGQYHKGGPDTGVFLQLIDQPETEVEIPETGISFNRLIAAQALGDYRALKERGRRVLRIDLGPVGEESLAALIEAIG